MKYLKTILMIGLFSFLCSNAFAKPPNYGKIWNSWTTHERKVFIMGFQQGILASIVKFSEIYDVIGADSTKFMLFSKSVSQKPVDVKPIQSIADSLYADSLNTYVNFGNVILLAEKKLIGDKIDKDLDFQRKQSEISKAFIEKIENDRDM